MRSLIVLLAVLIATPAWAQPAPDAPATRREKIKKKIRALRAYTLTEELALDEQTAGKLFPILAKWDDELDKLLVARADVQRRLEASATETDPKVLDKLIDDAVANQRALWDAEDKRLQQLRKILTPAQTARVLVVLPAMERKIGNQLRKAVQQHRLPAPPEAGGELGNHPFGPRGGIDPFERPPPRPAPRKPPPGKVPCDPFSTTHGCSDTID